MTQVPKIFVGTLCSGEAEFKMACESILSQKKVDIHHKIISNLPEIQAHNLLWSSWEECKNNFDYFVKVDADTVLIDDHALHRIVELFQKNPGSTGAQILLHDYFTDSLIAGLNCFHPKVIFQQASNKLMPDRVDFNHDIVLKGASVEHLNPIGLHCVTPHPRQAFHYGLHRKLKRQDDVLELVAIKWLEDGACEDARFWAIAGAYSASFWMRKSFDYSDDKFEKSFINVGLDQNRLTRAQKFARNLIGRGKGSKSKFL